MQIVDFNGMLTDDQIIATVRLTTGLYKIKGLLIHWNEIARESNLDLDPISIHEIGIMDNQIKKLIAKHHKAEEQAKSILFEKAANSLQSNPKKVYNRR